MKGTYVNVYEVGRAFGGLEEGGWFYDTGTPIASIPVELTDEERKDIWAKTGMDMDALTDAWDFALGKRAHEVRAEWAKKYPSTNARFSVLGGEDYEVVIEDHFAQPYPDTIPHYE